ncbi:MAG: class I SAM-dependent methyltransferase [Nitrososphaeraceae archaeon]
MLKRLLKNFLSEIELQQLYSSFDIIGDIIIIKIPNKLEHKKELIANTLINNIKTVKTVFAQSSNVNGEYRVRDLEFLSGENKTTTEYKEHGCIFKLDVSKVYFSPRLSTERLRISKMINKNEIITNMFGGIGTYSIIIAKKNPTCKIYNIDSNPTAYEFCKLNCKLNKVEDRVIPILGNAKQIIYNYLQNVSTRVLMPLPETAHDYVDIAVTSLKNKTGLIHFFSHIHGDNKLIAIDNAEEYSKKSFHNYKNEIQSLKVVREVGPRFYQVVSDILIK